MKTCKMKCPYCGKIFVITEEQRDYNERFKCKHCKRFNAGSIAFKDGVLIGVKL